MHYLDTSSESEYDSGEDSTAISDCDEHEPSQDKDQDLEPEPSEDYDEYIGIHHGIQTPKYRLNWAMPN